jgi:hypothetical protein
LDEQASFADAWAEMALAQGHAAIAVQLWSRMAMILAEISIQLAPVRRIYRDAQLERARDLLGSAAFDAAWDAGRALTWAQIRAMVEDGSPHDWSAPMYRTTDDGRSAAAS